jgi:uncharacterized protein
LLRRRPITTAALAGALLQFPAMTTRVLAGIHWQALKLYLKGVPVHTHPARASRDYQPLPDPGRQ